LWNSNKIDYRMEVVLGYYLGGFVRKAKGRIVHIVGDEVSTAWYNSLL
jgi:hypothetical protein